MIFYQRQGQLPQKKHTVFREPTSQGLLWEELSGEQGFEGRHCTKYHHHLPPQVERIEALEDQPIHWQKQLPLQAIHFNTLKTRTGDFIETKQCYLGNEHLNISVLTPSKNSECFYKNASQHQLYFVHEGAGTLKSEYGDLGFGSGDYLWVPKACIIRFDFKAGDQRLLLIESSASFRIPQEFCNGHGQLLENAPYSERDFRTPQLQAPETSGGPQQLLIQSAERWVRYRLPHHPFDLHGWDGYLYPIAFNIDSYSPIVGEVHQPPSVHKVLENEHFMITNFVPRLLDFHKDAIPVPYYHSNIDSEEVLYYVHGNFMSRKGIDEGSITLHPSGIPHGPQPGVVEASLDKKDVSECAIMIDAYEPLQLSQAAYGIMDPNYTRSWLP